MIARRAMSSATPAGAPRPVGRPPAKAVARGFTLLEVVLAAGMLAGIALMVSMLWSTLVRWQADSTAREESMRLHRVAELLREQWADRRATTPLTIAGDEFRADDRALAFVTAVPILFPEWPIVAVSYRIERSDDTAGGQRFALVYEERRVVSFDGPPATQTHDEFGRPLVRTMVLIDGSAELAWQRFGRIEDDATRRPREREAGSEERGDDERPAGPTGDSDADADRATSPDSAPRRGIGRSASRAASTRDPGIDPGSRLGEMDMHRPDRRTDLSDPSIDRWRAMEPGFAGRLPAIRLIGLVPPVLPPARMLRSDERFDEVRLPPASRDEQEVFACVLIAAGSP